MSEIEKRDKREKIVRGLEFAYTRLIDFKRSKKSPLIVSKGGKIVEMNAEDAPAKIKYLR